MAANLSLRRSSWSFKYNAGANPIAFTITFANAAHAKILEILTESYALA